MRCNRHAVCLCTCRRLCFGVVFHAAFRLRLRICQPSLPLYCAMCRRIHVYDLRHIGLAEITEHCPLHFAHVLQHACHPIGDGNDACLLLRLHRVLAADADLLGRDAGVAVL